MPYPDSVDALTDVPQGADAASDDPNSAYAALRDLRARLGDLAGLDAANDGSLVTIAADGTLAVVPVASGSTAFSGDGATTAFTIAHGLGSVPTVRAVWAESADAAAARYVSAVDDANVTVTFLVAPPAGTDNVVLGFDVRL